MGDDPADWRWGRLHTLSLQNPTFGKSGIGPIEWLFNRGPYESGGGSAIVNAIGWDAHVGYEVDWVPSMRMVVDLGDLDASTWVNLTGASGHAFHPHYDDQAPLWQRGDDAPVAVHARGDAGRGGGHAGAAARRRASRRSARSAQHRAQQQARLAVDDALDRADAAEHPVEVAERLGAQLGDEVPAAVRRVQRDDLGESAQAAG